METWEEEAEQQLEEIRIQKKDYINEFFAKLRNTLRDLGLKKVDIENLTKSIKTYVDYKVEEVTNRQLR